MIHLTIGLLYRRLRTYAYVTGHIFRHGNSTDLEGVPSNLTVDPLINSASTVHNHTLTVPV